MAANAAAVPLIVTVAAAPQASCLVLSFPANSPIVLGYRCLNWTVVPAPAAGGQATATLPMSTAIRAWGGRLTLLDQVAILAATTLSCFTIAYTGVAWTRYLTELLASGLLSDSPYELLRDSDAVLLTLTLKNPNSLSILAADFLPVESFDTPAAPAVPGVAAVAGRGRGRGRGLGGAPAVPAVPAVPLVPGPVNLAFLNNCTLASFAASGEPNALFIFARLVGAVGDCTTRASRLLVQYPANTLAHALRRSSAATAGVESAVAAPPLGDFVVATTLQQTIAAAYDALTPVLQSDKASTALFAKELTDALILQRGDTAQCRTVISSRLSLSADRCEPPPPPSLLGGKGGLCISVSPLHSTGTPFARYHARLHGAALPLHDVAPQTHTSRAWAASAPRA